MLIVLIGPDCAGKTTLAKKMIKDRPRGTYLKNDYLEGSSSEVYSSIVHFIGKYSRLPGVYIADRLQFPDEVIYSKVHGLTCRLSENQIQKLDALCAKNKACRFWYVTASDEELVKRYEQRGDERCNASNIVHAKALYERFISKSNIKFLTIDTTGR